MFSMNKANGISSARNWQVRVAFHRQTYGQLQGQLTKVLLLGNFCEYGHPQGSFGVDTNAIHLNVYTEWIS